MSSKTKLDKKDVKAPDAFHTFSERIFHWAEKHSKAIAGIFAVALVLALGYVGFHYMTQQKEQKAAQALYKPAGAIERAEERLREERAKIAGDKKVAQPESARPADYAKDFAPAVQELKSAIKDNSGSRAALMSSLNLVAFLLEKKQFTEALEVIEMPKYSPGSGEMLNGFYQMHRGVVYVEDKKFDEAEKAYKSILGSQALRYFHPEAMLKLGMTYELKGDQAKARQTYEKLEQEHPQSEASKTAGQYIRLLEMKPKQG
jgi:predicted negative regulator of RcsB-dependent stress response